MTAHVRGVLVDEMIDAYVDWREESSAVRDAYDLWARVPTDDRDLAFAAYSAALDREETACCAYVSRVRRVERELAVAAALLSSLDASTSGYPTIAKEQS